MAYGTTRTDRKIETLIQRIDNLERSLEAVNRTIIEGQPRYNSADFHASPSRWTPSIQTGVSLEP